MRRLPELAALDYATIHEGQKSSVDVLLLDVLRDRQREQAHGDRKDRVQLHPPDLARLSETERQRAQTNIRLLSLAKGHRGRIIRTSLAHLSSAESAHVRTLLAWADRTVASGIASVEPLVSAPPSDWWTKAESPEDLYERLVLIDRSGSNDGIVAEAWLAKTLGTIAGSADAQPKWIDLVKPVFDERNLKPRLERILKEIGFIPRGLTTRQTFRALPGSTLAAAVDALRDIESTALRPVARYERARLLNAMLIRGRGSDLRTGKGAKPVTLDANGIRIDLADFHAHLPYGLAEDGLFDVLERESWTNGEPTVTEMRLRAAEENMDGLAQTRLASEQSARFLKTLGIPTVAECARRASDAPDQFAKTLLETSLTIPDALVRELLAGGADGRFALLRIAEGIGASLTEERLTRRPHLFLSYDLMHEQDEVYASRSRVLNHPGYYNALKITRGWLSEPVASDPSRRFLALRGSYRQMAGHERHAFAAAVLDGRVTRVLIDEQKHLHAEQRANFEAIPTFDRDQYETLEDVLRTFDYYTATVNAIRKESAAPPKSWPRRYYDLAQTALHFVLSNVTAQFPEASRRYQDTIAERASRPSVEALLETLDEAKQTYAEFLYRHVGSPAELTQEFMPEVSKRDVSFGPDFTAYAERVCASDGYDRQLSDRARPVRLVTLNYKSEDPTGAIPYHIEESCLEALRLDRARPFVNVIGGCRFAGGTIDDPAHPLNRMASSILKVGHSVRANVAVPGTQSGIGVAFGLANVHYAQEFEHLPKRDQMHLFAVSPGGNTAYPGNELVERGEQGERFALTPVDSILTPFHADWGVTGMARLTVPYREHILYMEALYDRLSRDQRRVTVVGNGGIYSVMEVNEALKRGFNLLLLRDSGRFAEAASAMLASKESLGDGSPASVTRVIAIAESSSNPEAIREFLTKDFGADTLAPTETQAAFRVLFFEFLRIASQTSASITLTTLNALESDLRAAMQN